MTCIQLQAQYVHHEINVRIDIQTKSIDATDTIRIPASLKLNPKDTLGFYLNSNFEVKSMSPSLIISEVKSYVCNSTSDVKDKRYIINSINPNQQILIIPIHYSGKITGEIRTGAAEYARGFSEVSGIISDDGVYFANSTEWVPTINDNLFTFNLTTKIDSAWGVISQGKRTRNEKIKDKKIIRYESPNPVDEVYLVAAKWIEYNKQVENILVQAELRKPDTAMANKYLNATIDYIEMYSKLIGPYPYSKFTLVENFWETGYGMPSFTLLGEQIIRFPFILTSSYPHELLHNYWGNSVYVNSSKGNWCEGLTAYMADHLIKEQQGQANEYRRTTLQKYTDFVNESNDIPVSKFLNRNNSAEEAIGYGKSLMIYEMLRYHFGDDVFKKAISIFNFENKFKLASFSDIERSFEQVTSKDLKPFFDQWVFRKGAPTLALSNVSVSPDNGKYMIKFTISQTQKEDVFNLYIPVVFYLEGDGKATDEGSVVVNNVLLSKRSDNYLFTLEKRPLRIDVDPQFNVFRRLDNEEVPPTISQILGSKDVIMILPKNSPFIKDYTALADQWKQTQNAQGNNLEIIYDTDITEMPDKSTWIVGFDNKFAANLTVFQNYKGYLPDATLEQVETLKKTGGLVYVFKNPKNKLLTNGFLGTNKQKMVDGLKRKITHYSKYSFLGFEGDETTNKLKGEFPVTNSPLSYFIKYDGKIFQPKGKLIPRKALID